MTEPKPPTETLDEQERELARVLRALPGGEPPAALDQKILRAAANAAAASRRPRSRWLASLGSAWGVGGAAAAVLALGISWQLFDPSRPERFEPSAPAPAASAEDSAVTVDLGAAAEAPAADAAASPTPLPAAQAPVASEAGVARQTARPAAKVTHPARALPAPAFAPAPPPPVAAGSAAPVAVPQASAINAIDVASVESTSVLTAEQVGKLSAAQDSARDSAANKAEAAEALSARAKAAQAQAGAMTPAAWLAKVRQLRSEGRLDEARNSLELFHRYYPQYVIPADLAPLLRQ